MAISIYRDEGVSEEGLCQLCSFLQEEGFSFSFTNSDDLKDPDWNGISLFIISGGRDKPYHKKLQGLPNRQIRSFVEEGGTFLGICAGAYYATAFVDFHKDSPLEIQEERELAFFPGKGAGPAYGDYEYDSEKGARLSLIETDEDTFSVYHNGGCLFEDAEKYPNVSVLGRYGDLEKKPAAIIACQVGNGRAILSGAHLEYDLKEGHPFFEKIQASAAARKNFFRKILAKSA